MARKEKTIHYIYKTTCNVTGRYYVGMHSTCNDEDGYMGSGKRLRYSIRYHGKENHTREILEYCDSREELAKREREIVNLELIKEDLCMNLCVGGEGGRGFTSDEAKKGRAATNTKYSDKLKFWSSNGGSNRIAKHGVPKELLDNRCDWTNKKHSEETKELMSEKRKGTGVGETNSQYGTCWITKESLSKKIKKEELDTWTNEGWLKGRN